MMGMIFTDQFGKRKSIAVGEAVSLQLEEMTLVGAVSGTFAFDREEKFISAVGDETVPPGEYILVKVDISGLANRSRKLNTKVVELDSFRK